ncbi:MULTISPECIES: hypothetical protein [Listeria]|uniref:hypothetical protein n=1 Tax=Listeria TaxID=1637 RepID=UPI001628CF75|nr:MULTISPECIES: hypothetical protein [Listeria]MBC1814094.1 hypothetical protein [Listeria booriae]MBC1817139.1 hypothetical protein [Listeria seeligeri]
MKTVVPKMQMKKCACAVLAGGMLISSMSVPSLAQANTTVPQENTENQSTTVGNTLTNMETTLADKYVSYNEETKSFELSSSIGTVMPVDRVKLVESYVEETNKQLRLAENNIDEEAYAVTPSGDVSSVSNGSKIMLHKAGVTRVDYHWNYCRIKISAGALKFAVSGGIALSGVYAPAKIVRAACAIAGLSVSSIKFKNGVWFDYNYLIGVLTGNAGKQ